MILPALRLILLILLTAIVFALSVTSIDAARASSADRALLSASGVQPDALDHYSRRLDELAEQFHASDDPAGDPLARARALHANLHRYVLRGSYLASASDLGAALDGGPFNCAATSALFSLLAARSGLNVQVLSVPGHVWCRVSAAGETFDVETTCRDWFAIADRYAGVPTPDVSPAMTAHRRRAPAGRALSREQLLAIFHFNRGATFLRHSQFPAAALSNLRALTLDPACRPAFENLLCAASHCVP